MPDPEKLDFYKFYPCVDRVPGTTYGNIVNLKRHRVMAKATGEYREPKKGEWYLSGAIIEAYRAPNDLGIKFPIARLWVTETVTTIRQIEPYTPPTPPQATPQEQDP